MTMNEEHKLNVMEQKCLQSMCGVNRLNRWSIEKARCRDGVGEKMSG